VRALAGGGHDAGVIAAPCSPRALAEAYRAQRRRHPEDTYYESSDDEGQAATDEIDAFEARLRGDAPPAKKSAPLAPKVSVRALECRDVGRAQIRNS